MIHITENSELKLHRGKGETLHNQIKEGLIKGFANFAMNDKLPTDRALAKLLKVSPVTVNKVMSELDREGYVIRRQGKGTFLSSREKQVIREGRGTCANGQIVVAVPNYFSSEYWNRLHFAEEMAVKNGFELVEFKFHQDTSWESLLSLAERQNELQGLIISPLPDLYTRQVFDKFDKLGVPVAVFGNFPFITLGENTTSVTADWFKLNYLKANYLLEKGHSKIAYISNEPVHFDNNMTIKGQRQAYLDNGVNPKELIISLERAEIWKNSAEAGYLQTKKILENHQVTALNYDSTAGVLGGLRCLGEKGLKVPDDISIIATGGNPNFEEYFPPPLTIVQTDVAEELKMIYEVITDENHKLPKLLMSNPFLVERASVKDFNKSGVK